MRILAIRGRNLASLAGDFEVDFSREPLASSGLFAICGPTGAGKSTLLDALCLALYDATPRMMRARDATQRGALLPDVAGEQVGAHDPRTLLRRGAAEGHAEVDFVGGDGSAYRARWSVRRARQRATGKLQETQMTLATLPAGQPVGGGSKSEVKQAIAERIGLSFDQFTRAVLLAQNEFFAFLKANDDERAELLQALTGTERFAAISRRAHERNKAEQEALRVLREQLSAAPPLPADARQQAEQTHADLGNTVQALSARAAQLDAALQWHRRASKLEQEARDAAAAHRHAQAQCDAAAPLRDQLAQWRLAQPALALVNDVDRLRCEGSAAALQAQDARAAHAVAQQRARQADGAYQQALARRDAARQAEAEAAPRLARARTLDADIAALAAAHAQARAACDEAEQETSRARQQQADASSERESAANRLHAACEWLDQHAGLAPLGGQWLRWEQALAQAATLGAAGDKLRTAMARRRSELDTAQAGLHDAARALAEIDDALQAGEAQRRQWRDQLGAWDRDAVADRLREARQRRDALRQAQARWQASCTARERLNALREAADKHEARRRDCLARLAATQAARPAAQQACDNAERAWRLAYAACQQSVETLRNALEPDQPCPVCGATDHPYADPAAQPLRQVLAALEQDFERCRQALTQLEAAEHSDRAAEGAHAEALAELAPRILAAQRECEAASHAWLGDPVAEELGRDAALSATAQSDCGEWLAARIEAAAAQEQEAAEQDDRLRRVEQRLQTVQSELERLRIQRQAANDARELALSALTALQQRQAAEAEQAQARDEELRQVLLQLHQGALATALPAPGGPDWQVRWAADPVAFQRQCARAAQQWIETEQSRDALRQRLAELNVTLQAAADTLSRAEQQSARAGAALQGVADRLSQLRAERRAVFADPADGDRHVDEIAARLAAAHSEASDAAERAAADRQQAGELVAGEAMRVEQAEQTREALQRALAQARDRLNAWLLAQPMTEETLRELLRLDAQWVAEQDEALRQRERARDAAQALAGARQAERRQWLAQRPPLPTALWADASAGLQNEAAAEPTAEPAAEPPAGLRARAAAAADATLLVEGEAVAERDGVVEHGDGPGAGLARAEAAVQAMRQAVQRQLEQAQQALGEAGFALRRDDERRAQAAALLERIEQQEANARVWQILHELIGSADGKKFRNHAQQITLDILLGYANRHLQTLSRRYRLERLPDSLGLLVIDHDMGDEARSVHSLSGGESFLVSLALALGLASLSSHRVRVESLFIDEGFGSLDSDTLRVAMDALDSLQAQGRKVGVISHVQEMTERIGTRIEVRRLAGGQSRITVGGDAAA